MCKLNSKLKVKQEVKKGYVSWYYLSIRSAFRASWKSGISSAAFATLLHVTTPFPSTAKLPEVCQRLPLSVGLFHMLSCFPVVYTEYIDQGFRTCQALETPSPHFAYNSLSESTITLTSSAPPTESSHFLVAPSSEWETATKFTSGCFPASLRSCWKVFSATKAGVSRMI